MDTECLQAEFLEQDRQVAWLRLEPEDGDPATFILSLLQVIAARMPASADALYQQLRQNPGHISGWASHFHHLAQALAETLGESGALVLEHLHKLAPAQPVLGLVANHLLPLLPDTFSCILITHERLPSACLPAGSASWGVKELQLPAQAGLNLAHGSNLCLPDKTIQQAIHLAGGRIGALKALFSACDVFGQDFLLEIIQAAKDVEHMLAIILSRWLATLPEEERQALALCTQTGYFHPDLLEAGFEMERPAPGPWLQLLGGGWLRLRCLWEAPVSSAIHQLGYPTTGLYQQLCQRLAGLGAVEQSIRLSCASQNYHEAASTLARSADRWMEFGQWDLLESFLDKLPESVVDDYPQLLYAHGEILALTGQGDRARRSFSRATTLFISQGDLPGGCQSLLAESAVCASQADSDRAQLCALAARDLAHSAGFADLQNWANWQLGSLALALDQLPAAREYLSRALTQAGESQTDHSPPVFQHLSEILQQLATSEEQIRYHYNAYRSAENATQAAARELRALLTPPGRDLAQLFPGWDWSHLPVSFKLASLDLELQDTLKPGPGDWRQRLSGLLKRLSAHRLLRQNPGPVVEHEDEMSLLQISLALPGQNPSLQPPAPRPAPVSAGSPVTTAPLTLPAPALVQRMERPALRLAPNLDNPDRDALAVYCLGPFRLYQAGKWIETWPSRKAQLILKYLLLNRSAIVSKDILMDTFWRDSEPEAARRNLHQAIYALRQILKVNSSEVQHILFENDGYRLNPVLSLWVDYEEFQEHVRIGQQLVRANLPDEALDEYVIAESLYQGELLAEDIYEDWIQPQRQALLHQYITVAGYLTHYHLARGEYAAAITLCQRILARDSCHEEAHRNLMQCYLHLGQRNLAVRQYQLCLKALKDELNLAPSEETRQLYRQVVHGLKQPTH